MRTAAAGAGASSSLSLHNSNSSAAGGVELVRFQLGDSLDDLAFFS